MKSEKPSSCGDWCLLSFDDHGQNIAEYLKGENTQLFLFTDRPTNARLVVLAFRGTEPFNALDWSTDLDFSLFPLEGLGKVHMGFLKHLVWGHAKYSSRSLFPRKSEAHFEEPKKLLAYHCMTQKIKQLMEENPEAKLYVTGHSLGGALAALYTTLLFYKNETLVTDRLGAVYTFGQPRVGDDEFSRYVMNRFGKTKYFRVVYSNDVVPRLPFDDNLFRFKHGGFCYYFNACYKGEVCIILTTYA
ncbi:hypothetical protein Mapa_015887 [Marchantia paleacea]|nr:hypothetical protein Mapa_015887 [Marchantia paleacea]